MFVRPWTARVALASALAWVALAAVSPSESLAQQNADTANAAGAKEAYDSGTAAYLAGDYSAAAELFDRADTLAPHPTALTWALKSVLLAKRAILGMKLVERSERTENPKVRTAAKRVADAFSAQVGAVDVSCPAEAECKFKVDGAIVERRTLVRAGAHVVAIGVNGKTEVTDVTVPPRETVMLVGGAGPTASAGPSAGPAASAEPPDPNGDLGVSPRIDPVKPDIDDGGLSPAFFGLGLGLTAVAGGFAIASGVHTLDLNDEYLARRQFGGDEEGKAAQLRTNILIGTTAGLAAATGVIAIVTDWGGDEPKQEHLLAAPWLGPGVAGLSVFGAFQ